jgi:hypothetical protein
MSHLEETSGRRMKERKKGTALAQEEGRRKKKKWSARCPVWKEIFDLQVVETISSSSAHFTAFFCVFVSFDLFFFFFCSNTSTSK